MRCYITTLGVLALAALPSWAMAQDTTDGAMEVEDSSGSAWVLGEALYWKIGSTNTQIVVPEGFVHDKASIPRPILAFLPPSGRYTRPAVIHDYLYWTRLCSRRQADNLFMIAMKENGVGPTRRTLIYRAVRIFGGRAWKNNDIDRKSGYTRFIDSKELKGNKPWHEIREELKINGESPSEPVEVDTGYCQLGNFKNVPAGHIEQTKLRL